MLATPATALPAGERWSYEVKWDGYRTIAVKDGARTTLYSRNLRDATALYPAIARAIAAMSEPRVMLDGELVALDADGRPSFQALHHQAAERLAFYVFDLLHVNGRDLMAEPLEERRRALARLTLRSPIFLSEPLPGAPPQIEAAIKAVGLEGVIAKRRTSRYEAGKRSGAWLKVKFQARQEFVIGGFTEAAGAPGTVDALVIGYHEGGRLLSAGKVRAGLTPPLRRELHAELTPLKTRACPFANLPESGMSHWGEGITADAMADIVWLKPAMVAEVAFTEWTRDGHLRHATFVGVRTDKHPTEIRRER